MRLFGQAHTRVRKLGVDNQRGGTVKFRALTIDTTNARFLGLALLTRPKLVVPLALLLFTVSASAQSAVYVVTGNNQFGTIDLRTGAFHAIGNPTPEGQANLVWGPEGSLFSLTYSVQACKLTTLIAQKSVATCFVFVIARRCGRACGTGWPPRRAGAGFSPIAPNLRWCATPAARDRMRGLTGRAL